MRGSVVKYAPLGAITLLGALVIGCAYSPAFIPEKDPATASQMRRLVAGVRSLDVSALHRAVLSIGKKQYAMTIYLETGGEGTRLVGVSDLGMTLFQVERDSEGVRADKFAPGLRRKLVLDGILRDMEVIYRLLPPMEAKLGWDPPKGVFFNSRNVFKFDPNTGAMADYLEYGFGRNTYEAHVDNLVPAADAKSFVPGNIKIVNRRLGYALELVVMEICVREGKTDVDK